MVGIAGAAPNPLKPDEHVSFGDIVVSGTQGSYSTTTLLNEPNPFNTAPTLRSGPTSGAEYSTLAQRGARPSSGVDPMETADADLVNEAGLAIQNGDLKRAERLLLDVIERAPEAYEHIRVNGKFTEVRCWDKNEFIHYCKWHNAQGTQRPACWVGNAYPRAYFYLGFIRVKQRRYDFALPYLVAGAKLDPEHPKLKFETAQALGGLRRLPEALALYTEVVIAGLGPRVSLQDLAIAFRGRGFVLIELGELVKAREAYERSLEYEPESTAASDQLRYIAQVLAGGPAQPGRLAQFKQADLTRCYACGATGRSGVLHGTSFACDRCAPRSKKPWWRFWA